MRPRERYGHAGPEGFGDAELLALVLGTGTAGRSAGEIAASLLSRHGSLEALARVHPTELSLEPGVGPARAVRLHAALEAGRRSLRQPGGLPEVIRDADEAWAILGPRLMGLVDEELHALYLDRRGRPLATRRLTRGSDAYTVVDPRQIFREAVSVRAASTILAHNHPSGDPEPSQQDLDITRRVASAGQVLSIPLLDHLVIGRGAWVSLAERGELRPWEAKSAKLWTADR